MVGNFYVCISSFNLMIFVLCSLRSLCPKIWTKVTLVVWILKLFFISAQYSGMKKEKDISVSSASLISPHEWRLDLSVLWVLETNESDGDWGSLKLENYESLILCLTRRRTDGVKHVHVWERGWECEDEEKPVESTQTTENTLLVLFFRVYVVAHVFTTFWGPCLVYVYMGTKHGWLSVWLPGWPSGWRFVLRPG